MLANFLLALKAVLPPIMLMAFGYFLREKKLFTEEFFSKVNSLAFRFLLPSLMFYNIYSSGSFEEIDWILVLYTVCGITVTCILAFTLSLFVIKEPKSRAVAVQCAFRPNSSLIALPVATAIGGQDAAAAMSIVLGFGVPVLNFLSVFVLSVYSDDGSFDIKKTLKKIVTNPLIIGCSLGILTLIIRSLIPVGANGEPVFTIKNNIESLYKAIDMMGKPATPLMLIAIGGLMSFDFSEKGSVVSLIYGTIWRMILCPVLVVGIASVLTLSGTLSFDSVDFCVLIPFFGAPAPVASAVMAAEMHSDAPLARRLILSTSVLLVITLPLLIASALSLGFILP